jgi:hypothetical protein
LLGPRARGQSSGRRINHTLLVEPAALLDLLREVNLAVVVLVAVRRDLVHGRSCARPARSRGPVCSQGGAVMASRAADLLRPPRLLLMTCCDHRPCCCLLLRFCCCCWLSCCCWLLAVLTRRKSAGAAAIEIYDLRIIIESSNGYLIFSRQK